jgi:heptose-I-phosphate ethanolaminephosphotransferase
MNKNTTSYGLKQWYTYIPFTWLLVCIYPLLVLIAINPNSFDSRDIAINVVWLALVYALYSIIRQRWVWVLALAYLCLDAGLNLLHIVFIHGPVSANSLFVVANTNTNEASEFVQLKSNYNYWFVLFFFSLVLWAIRTSYQKPLVFWKKNIALLVFGACFIFFAENTLHQRFVRKAVLPTTRAFISFAETQRNFLQQKPRVRKQVQVNALRSNPDVVIIILGESLTRRHMQLYGYARATNPLLTQRNDLVVYHNAVSPYSHTLTALLSSLTTANIDNQQAYDSSLSVLDVYASAGYKTYWLSNQSPAGLWDNAIYRLAQTAHRSVFINRQGNSSFDATLQASYDEDLIPILNQALHDTASKKFIVVHLMGNHSLYEKRYPQQLNYFNEESNNKQHTINTYDNAVRYNDFVMNTFFDSIAQKANRNTNTHYALCYWSDHGENVYDENNTVGHDYTGLLPWTQIEVPFMLWLSNNHPLKPSLAPHQQTLFMTDDALHSVLDLGGLRTPAYDSTRSIFHPAFNTARPAKLEDGNVYH